MTTTYVAVQLDLVTYRAGYTDPGCQAMPRLCLDTTPPPPPCNHLGSGKNIWRLLQAAHLNCLSSECLLPRTLAVKTFGFTISQRSQSGI